MYILSSKIFENSFGALNLVVVEKQTVPCIYIYIYIFKYVGFYNKVCFTHNRLQIFPSGERPLVLFMFFILLFLLFTSGSLFCY